VFVLGLFLSDSRSLERDTAPDFRAATTVDVRTDVVLQTPETVNLVVDGTVDGVRTNGPVTWAPGRHEVAAGSELRFPAGSPVPTVAGSPTTDRAWLEPGSGDAGNQMLAVYSVLIAGALGTMGLPHVLVRPGRRRRSCRRRPAWS
jgi:Na+(H+)/acetate symporter ActP